MGKVTITNKLGLPEPLVKAIKFDGHITNGDISVTALIDAPRIFALKSLLPDREEDASDRMWMLWGTAAHYILQKSDPTNSLNESLNDVLNLLREKGGDNPQFKAAADWLSSQRNILINEENARYICEKTFTADVTTEYGTWTISGTIDLYDKETQTIQDYKLCTTYKWTSPESQAQWIRQLTVYRWLLEKNGYPVKNIQIVPMFRNWSLKSLMAAKLKRKNYPEYNTMLINIPTTNPEWTEEYRQQFMDKWVADMVRDHQKAQLGDVRDCDGRERWAVAPTWKIYADGSTKALAIKESEKELDKWLEENSFRYHPSTKFVKKTFEGESRRCEQYCPVYKMCPQVRGVKLAKKSEFDRLMMEAELPDFYTFERD